MTGMFLPHDITAANMPHLELLPPDAAIGVGNIAAGFERNHLTVIFQCTNQN
jgi:hypothetical protein